MRRIFYVKLSLLVLLAFADFASAQTSAFTYQGKLTDTSAAANGQYDFTFRLFDDLAGGTQIGSGAVCNGAVSGNADAVCDNVQVSGGIFTVNLSFGADAFADGGLRFLEISVRTGTSTGAYTTLTPLQQVTSSPFSLKSRSATFADTLSAACVLCVTDAKIQSIDAGKITGVLPIANGGTGSATKNFVDLSTNQTISGNKTFTQLTTLTSANIGSLSGSFANIASLFGGSATFGNVAITNPDPMTISGRLEVGQAVFAEQFAGSGEGLFNMPANGLSGVVPVANGGTGSSTQNFVDLSSSQTVDGYKNFIDRIDVRGKVYIGTPAGPSLDLLHVAGTLRLDSLGFVGTTTLCRNSLFQISTCSSSLRYKTNIAPFSYGLSFITQLRPIVFDWKTGGAADVGFGAEDVAKINPLFVTYNDKGEVEGVKYDRLSVVFVNAFKEQQMQINQQQEQIDTLKKLVCELKPEAAICKEN